MQRVSKRDEWLVSQLLKTNEQLIKQLEDGQALPVQLEIQINDLGELATQNGIQTAVTITALPWMLRVQQILFGQWEMISDDQECCCTYCGSNQVSRKSRGGQACPSKGPHEKIYRCGWSAA